MSRGAALERRRRAGLVVCLLVLCGSPGVRAAEPELPASPEDQAFFEFVRTLDVADTAIGLKSNRGGTSAYAVLVIDGQTWGALLPENSATSVYGEAAAFDVARALGIEEVASPGRLYELHGAGLTRFRDFLAGQQFSGQKEENRNRILARIAASTSIPTVVKIWRLRPYDYDRGVSRNRLVLTDPIAKFLDNGAPQASSATVTLPGVPGSAREIDLARSLSKLFVIDALTGQWDRFSGGNLQVASENGTIRFVGFDNGGTWGGKAALGIYLSFLRRFDRATAERLFQMDDFVAGRSPSYLGFTKPTQLQSALGLSKRADYWKMFQSNLAKLVGHIRQLGPGQYFEEGGQGS